MVHFSIIAEFLFKRTLSNFRMLEKAVEKSLSSEFSVGRDLVSISAAPNLDLLLSQGPQKALLLA